VRPSYQIEDLGDATSLIHKSTASGGCVPAIARVIHNGTSDPHIAVCGTLSASDLAGILHALRAESLIPAAAITEHLQPAGT
jgi:hypothetical protein